MGDYTIQEIQSQPEVWSRILEAMWGESSPLQAVDRLTDSGPVLFIGCGSSYYLSLSAAAIWSRFAGGPASALSASEVMLFPECHFDPGVKGTVVAVSRSGKTTETCAGVTYLRRLGWHAIGISCTPASAVAEACDASLLLDQAAEKSRFMSRAFTGTLLAVQTWVAFRTRDQQLKRELLHLPDLGCVLLERYARPIRDIAVRGKFDQYVFLGQGPYYGLAAESMLKTKEMACTPAEAYHSLELWHGPRYALTGSAMVVLLLSDGGRAQELALLPKIKSFGAQVAVICERATPEVTAYADWVLELNSCLPEYARMLLVMPLTQLFAYHRACALGKTID
jgi:glucosamine--fructose-6-phosphate aminotransferase (isomerizing)